MCCCLVVKWERQTSTGEEIALVSRKKRGENTSSTKEQGCGKILLDIPLDIRINSIFFLSILYNFNTFSILL